MDTHIHVSLTQVESLISEANPEHLVYANSAIGFDKDNEAQIELFVVIQAWLCDILLNHLGCGRVILADQEGQLTRYINLHATCKVPWFGNPQIILLILMSQIVTNKLGQLGGHVVSTRQPLRSTPCFPA